MLDSMNAPYITLHSRNIFLFDLLVANDNLFDDDLVFDENSFLNEKPELYYVYD